MADKLEFPKVHYGEYSEKDLEPDPIDWENPSEDDDDDDDDDKPFPQDVIDILGFDPTEELKKVK